MIMNGQLGAMDETYLSKRKTNIVILASIVAIVLVKSIFFRITILMLLLTGSKIHPQSSATQSQVYNSSQNDPACQEPEQLQV
jgi:hypothetical protein